MKKFLRPALLLLACYLTTLVYLLRNDEGRRPHVIRDNEATAKSVQAQALGNFSRRRGKLHQPLRTSNDNHRTMRSPVAARLETKRSREDTEGERDDPEEQQDGDLTTSTWTPSGRLHPSQSQSIGHPNNTPRGKAHDVAKTRLDEVEGNPSIHSCKNSSGESLTFPRVPDFIIGGTQKGGTTALQELIKHHPLVVGSNAFEAHFFDYDQGIRSYGNRNLRGLAPSELCDLRASYAAKFPIASLLANPQHVSFEKTPAYILDEIIPSRIKAVTPWAKVIFSLRNPIDRGYSHWLMMRSRNQLKEKDTFELTLATDLKVLELHNFSLVRNEPFPRLERVRRRRVHHLWKAKNLVYRGLYAEQLLPWLEYFTVGEDLLVVQFERMMYEPHTVLDEIWTFLDVHLHRHEEGHLNKSYSPVTHNASKHDMRMNDSTREYLQKLYKPYNEQLADILGEKWRDVWTTTLY